MMPPPAPRITDVDRPFWEGCNAGRLMLQRCCAENCSRHVFFPRVCCPYCGGGVLAWEPASGRGTVRSFTIVHRPGHEAFLPGAPYVFGAIVLAEGPLIYARLDVSPDRTAGLMGRQVTARFRQDLPDQKLLWFAADSPP